MFEYNMYKAKYLANQKLNLMLLIKKQKNRMKIIVVCYAENCIITLFYILK